MDKYSVHVLMDWAWPLVTDIQVCLCQTLALQAGLVLMKVYSASELRYPWDWSVS